MKLSGLVPLAVIAWPILEIAAFVEVGSRIGVLATILLVLAAALLGVSLIRLSGLRLLTGLRRDLDAGRMPAQNLVGGTMTAVAGLLLILPGFVSDVVALLLLLPPVQQLVARKLSSGITVVRGGPRPGPARPVDVVDLDPEDFARHADPSSPWRPDREPPRIDGR